METFMAKKKRQGPVTEGQDPKAALPGTPVAKESRVH